MTVKKLLQKIIISILAIAFLLPFKHIIIDHLAIESCTEILRHGADDYHRFCTAWVVFWSIVISCCAFVGSPALVFGESELLNIKLSDIASKLKPNTKYKYTNEEEVLDQKI